VHQTTVSVLRDRGLKQLSSRIRTWGSFAILAITAQRLVAPSKETDLRSHIPADRSLESRYDQLGPSP
jgi:hypothetical protein